MKYRYPLAILALLGLLVSAVPLDAAQAQGSPTVAIELSPSGPVEPGTEIAVTISYAGLDVDSDGSTIDYIFRADVKNADDTDADACEDQAGGYGLGVDRNMRRVDSNPEVRRGKVSADCPAGSYTIKAVISSAAKVELASASASFTVGEPATDEPDETDEECSYDPTPTEVTVDAVPIEVESTADDYFVLYVQHDLAAGTVDVPVLVKRGEAGTTTLAENVKALPKERYRVEKYLIADPADVDGDCIDDITELDDFGSKNPVNSAAAIDTSKGAVAVPDQATWLALAQASIVPRKFTIIGADTDKPYIYFQNTETYSEHYEFLNAIGIDPYGPGVVTGALTYASRLVAPGGSQGTYVYEFVNAHPFSIADLSLTMLAASVPLLSEGKVVYFIRNKHLPANRHEIALYEDSRVNLRFEQDIFGEREFRSLNEAVGYGFLRVMDLDERPNPRDVVLYEALPNDLPRVAGIITTVSQTPLSHVNLRAVQDGVPNAYIRDARTNYVNGLVGRYVRYEVSRLTYSVRAATRAEVDAHFASSRPSAEQTPQRDLSVTEIKSLGQIGFNDWRAFGVKAANVAVLGTRGFPAGTVPDGFAIPFYFYDEFMKHNGFFDDIEEMLADADFQTDLEEQEKKLKKLRKAIKKGQTPQWIIDALTGMHRTYPDGQSLRYRSSTNNEDLPGFSGAGLYDSKTQKPDETEEDGIDKSLKQVYASLWNFRAFSEREFHRIDHLSAAMGVLVHPNYSDELVNGVAVSFNPLVRGASRDFYYVNSQVGEDLVTNPDAFYVPEELLLHPGRSSYDVIHTSGQKPPGQLLMSDSQVNQLRRHLTTVLNRFKRLYNPPAGEEFAMEIEFKITSDNVLAIKQARPWVFESSTAGSDASVAEALSKDATLSALTLGGVDIGTFASTTTRYAASVANGVTETTVTPTVSDDGATHEVKLDGTADADGTVALAVGSNVITVEVTSEDGNTIRAYTVTVTRAEASGTDDATLSALELSGVDIGTFDPATTEYTASVANDVAETTVTATVNDSGAAYAVKLGGTEDADGTVALAVGANTITIEVTAEDGQTTKTYRVTVTRAVPPLTARFEEAPQSHDGTDPFTFRIAFSEAISTSYVVVRDHALEVTGGSVTGAWRADSRNDLWGIRVQPDSDADVEIALPANRACDTQGAVCTADDKVLSNRPEMTIPGPAPVNSPASGAPTISGTAQVGQILTASTSGIADSDGLTNATFSYQWIASDGTTDTDISGATGATYALADADEGKTVNVRVTFTDDGGNGESLTSAATGPVAPPPSNDATLSALTMSGVNFGTFNPATTDYTASVGNDVTETTVTPTVNDSGATYVVKLGGVADADGTVALAVGANVITVEVTAEDGQTNKTYRVTVTRAAAPPVTNPVPQLTARFEEAPQSHDGTNPFTFRIAFSEAISVSFVTIRDHALEVTGGSVTGAWRVDSRNDSWGIRVQPDSAADVEIALPANRACDTQGAVCTEDDKVLSNRPEMTIPGPAPVNSPATGAPTISGTVQVGQTLTASTSGIADANGLTNAVFSYQWIASDGTTDTDITGAAAATYTLVDADEGKTVKVRVTFTDDGGNGESLTSAATGAVAAPPSNDATLSGLTLSGVDFGTFNSATTSYTASVGNDVTETTVTPTANDDGATYAVRLGGVEDADGTVALAVGASAVTVVVTAEDGNTTKTYTVTVTRAEAPPSTDATLGSLNLSGINIGTFNPATTDYTASVGNELTETTVTATANDDGATYAVKLGGVEDADGTVDLAVGANAVTIEVTAEDGNTTRTYTVTVTRAEAASTTAPDVPGRPSGRLTGVGSVALDWNDVPAADSYDVMLWQVDAYVQLSADAPVNGISITFDGSGATASGLPADYEWYYFVVRAVNDAGASDWSPYNAVSARPAAPDSPTGRSTGSGTVSLDWNDVTAATSYEVSFWQGGDYITLSADAPVSGVSITFNGSGAAVSGLPTDYDWYYFRVRAVNDAGASDWSDYGSVAAP